MKVLILVFAMSLMVGSLSLAAGDAAKGKAKAVVCAACHGNNGISANDLWPNLAGQKPGYTSKQIKDFKSGVRKDPLMSAQANLIKDEDIDDLSAYFSSLK